MGHFPVTANEAGTLDKLFADADATAEIKELAMAATMLSLLEHYSEHLLLSLLDLYAANAFNDASLSMKALCCALIAMHCHRETIQHSSAISLRIANIADSERGRRDIMTVFLQFIRSRSTERISQKVRDELVPKLMKLSPEMRRKMRDGFSDDIEEMAKNPDWQEMLNESGITDKMQELSRMQAEGSDVFLSSFARLKSFPFFNDVANWFVPFTPRHSSIFRVFAGNSGSMLLSMVDRTGAFCDSDKFSFALSVATMPDQHRSMMMAQFDEQQEQVINEMAGSLPNPDKQRENIANKYVQSLYRFFNLFRSRNDFYNPFSTRLNLIDVPFVSDALSDTKSLRLIAEFYFSMQCYTDALSTFGKVLKQDSPTASDYQKTGYCHEQLKQYVLATADYEKVELLKPNDVWTLKHLALCYRAVNDTEKAIANYKRAEALQPDNVALANNIANCLLEGGRIEEALKYFFKVDYLASKGERTMRPIAWCSFLIGNYSQSVDYYNRIIAKQPGANDYINRGHALLCSGQVKDAVASYMDAVDKSGGSEVLKTLDDDLHYLLDAGVDKLTIALIFDKIRYKGLGTSENM
ncbi:MAG: tetratricopeptide repeat protein [Bacteroidales bacterium]|nr:MAG: tetratricopeptide repeat protein [Bacteroidales bacterium]